MRNLHLELTIIEIASHTNNSQYAFFRTDSALSIGNGHVMRCLTLALELHKRDFICKFICREHEGAITTLIENWGFEVQLIPVCDPAQSKQAEDVYLDWLGASIQQDVTATISILTEYGIEKSCITLIVDHYEINEEWEIGIHPFVNKILVIDDLADRKHFCDYLIDQTYARTNDEYEQLTPAHCQLAVGSKYALLRNEFREWRNFSLERRKAAKLVNIQISMGGADPDNFTCQILDELTKILPGTNFNITVVIGRNNPNLKLIRSSLTDIENKSKVVVDATNMAELAAYADLAIGAAGSSTWERCCLGLPSILLVTADNQRAIAENLKKSGAVLIMDNVSDLGPFITSMSNSLDKHSKLSMSICDGLGSTRVANLICSDSACNSHV